MKILLCILSEQHIPNLLSVHHFKPDRLVLLQTSQMEKNRAGMNFLSALSKSDLITYTADSLVKVDQEDSIKKVTSSLEAAYAKYSSDDWIINLTGGTKIMSIAAYEFFKNKSAKLVYVNHSDPSVFLDLEEGTSEKSDYQPTIEEFLEGYGYEHGKKLGKVKQAETRAECYWRLSRLLAKNAESENIVRIDQSDHTDLREGNIGLQTQFYKHLPDFIQQSIEQTFSANERSHGNKYMGEFMTGGWLEVFFWELLKKHAQTADVWDIHLGIEPKRKGITQGANNDMDVAFMRRHTLSFIECKSGSQNNDPKNDILYKIMAIRKQLGALRVKAFLATTAEHVNRDAVVNRAELYECTIIGLAQIQQLAKHWQDIEIVQKVFRWKPST